MSLDFVIIPVTKTLENSAYNIRNKLNSAVKIPITIDLDINYKFPLHIHTQARFSRGARLTPS